MIVETKPKLSLSEFARTIRARQQGLTEPPPLVKVWEPERDLTAGAHVCSESIAMRDARKPLVRRLPKGN